MSDPRRLEFVTRHFRDLQTIRFAPAPIAMILIAVAQPLPQVRRITAWSIVLVFSVRGHRVLPLEHGIYQTALRRRAGE